MKTPYRILKLKSGEQIIARLRGEERGKIVIERPMVFMTRVIMDPYSGRQRELTVLKNWLNHTNEIQTSIPKDYIATYLVPDTDVLELYSLEKNKEDNNPKKPKLTDMSEYSKNNEPDFNDEASPIENLISDVMKDALNENPDLLDDIKNNMSEENNINEKNFITMSMFLPPEALLSLVEAGLIDEDDILNLIENINGTVNRNKYTGDDEKRKESNDFGNLWTDWSPDLEDYL